MRILLGSNAVWCTRVWSAGEGSPIPRLSALECVGGAENVVLHFWYGLSGGTMRLGPHLALPGFKISPGADLVGEHETAWGSTP